MRYSLPVSDFDPAAQGSKVNGLGVGGGAGWGSPPAVKEKRSDGKKCCVSFYIPLFCLSRTFHGVKLQVLCV